MELQRRRVSYDELAQMPEDGRRYELYDGEVFVVPSPILLHQVVAMRLWRILDDYAVQTGGLAVASPIAAAKCGCFSDTACPSTG